MTVCPKCGSRRIIGPVYMRSVDRLHYKCEHCGYAGTTETADKAKARAALDDVTARARAEEAK